MPETAEGFIWETATTLSKHAIEHVRARMDKAAGVGAFAPPPLTYAPPQFQPPALPVPKIPSLGAAAGGAAAASVLTEEATSQTRPSEAQGSTLPPLESQSPMAASEPPLKSPQIGAEFSDNSGYSYAEEVAEGIACAKCTHGHLRAMAAAASSAEQAVRQGDADTARSMVARVLAESAVLKEYDWQPAKVRRTPEPERRLVEQAMPCVREAERAAQGPPKEVTLAWGSIDEAVRFARSPRLTDSDRREVEARLRRYYDTADLAERVLAAPNIRDTMQDREAKREAAQHLREARHALEAGDPYAADTLEVASAHLEAAAVALTPPPTPEQARRLAEQCRVCRTDFEDGYLDLLRSQRRSQ